MNYNHLHYFHVIAREGSLARAARQLHLSQSTLSAQLKQLEDYLETRLFDRTGSSLRLNAQGRQAMGVTQEMFRLADRLEEILPGDRPPVKIRLEIGVATTVSRSLALDRFVRLFESNDVLTRIRQGDHEYLLHELISSGLDLLVSDSLPERFDDRGLDHRVIGRPDFAIIVGAAMWEDMRERSSAALHHCPFIHYTSHSSYRFEIDQFFRDQRIEPKIVAEADDVYVIRDAVARGIGFGIVPRAIIGLNARHSGIKVIGSVEGHFRIHALYNRKDASDEVLAALEILAGKDLEREAIGSDDLEAAE